MKTQNNTLLPSGLMDVLPPLAAAEFDLIGNFLRSFQGFGYQPVIPPLAEYAETLLAGQGAATEHHVLRMTDPLNTRQLALRADITGQVARIAGGTLGTAPRPLRLCYAGYTLRAAPEALETRRQHTQVGIERFGDMSTHAIAEVLAISVYALTRAGVEGLTLDLTYPAAMSALLAEFPEAARAAIHDAVRLKDSAQLRTLGATVMADVLDASGAAASVLPRLASIQHPVIAKAVAELSALTQALAAQQVPASLSIDLLDLAGYGYYSGIGYALYWNAARLEVGRGGCYRTAGGEDAAGFTLYINDLLDQLGSRDARPLKTILYGTPATDAARLQAEGFVTIYGE